MRVSQDVLTVLDQARCIGTTLSIAHLGQLDRKLYAATNKALEAAGGKWNRKAQVHLFEGDAAEAIEPIILTGEIVSVRQELQQFFTPPDLAERVIAAAQIRADMEVLEPSAGRGALAAPAFLLGAQVDCIEIDPRNVGILASVAYRHVIERNFLTADPDRVRQYDRVVMNPPFARGQDIRHVTHARRFLRPGGRLVAIMSPGFTFRNRGIDLEFRDDLSRIGATVEHLPAGSFRSAGTDVNACLVTITVPGEA